MISRPIKIPELVSDRHSFQNQHKTGARKGSPMPGQVVNLTLFCILLCFLNVVFCISIFYNLFAFFVCDEGVHRTSAWKRRPFVSEAKNLMLLFVFYVCVLYLYFSILYFCFENRYRAGARKGSPMAGEVVNLPLFVPPQTKYCNDCT